jgi:hypothetical protein
MGSECCVLEGEQTFIFKLKKFEDHKILCQRYAVGHLNIIFI